MAAPLIALIAVLPTIYAAPLERRIQPPGDLYGPTGKPNFWDVQQTTIPNCGWPATLAAISHVDPDWLTTIISDNGDGESATFDIWDYPAYVKNPQVVKKSDLPDNACNKGTAWWPGGLEHAAVQAGNEMPGISPGNALAIQTGIKHNSDPTDHFLAEEWGGLNQDKMWKVFEHATESPIVLQTGSGGTLVGNHNYAVLNVTDDGGRRRIALYNPWGGDDIYDYDTIWPNTIMVHHLRNYEGGPVVATESVPKPDQQPETVPEPVSKPEDEGEPKPSPKPPVTATSDSIPIPEPTSSPEPVSPPKPSVEPSAEDNALEDTLDVDVDIDDNDTPDDHSTPSDVRGNDVDGPDLEDAGKSYVAEGPVGGGGKKKGKCNRARR